MKLFYYLAIVLIGFASCAQHSEKSAMKEQAQTEVNQQELFVVQPPPRVKWSMERDNLIKRFKLMNDKSVVFYMYVIPFASTSPIGYYQVNKVSSVNSQLTNTEQVIKSDAYNWAITLPSPAEDGSYGSNGDGVFGFTPDDLYIEHNMQYIVATAPLNFPNQPTNLGAISVNDVVALKALMKKLE